MSLGARTRTSLYTKLVPLLGEDDANALMSEFPANDGDEFATKGLVQTETALLRAEIADVRTEMRTGFAEVRVEMADGFRRQTTWLVGAIVASNALVARLVTLG